VRLSTQQEELVRTYLCKNLRAEELAAGHFLDRLDDQDVRMGLAEIDLEFFNRFYLAQHFNLPPAPIHRVLTKKLQNLLETPGRRNGVYVMPRGHAKTTIATLGLPLWCTAFRKRTHIPIISDSFDQAKDQLETIKLELEENDLFCEDFGELRGETWQAADIMTKNRVRIRALGQGMKVRGRKVGRERPDLIVVDDIEEIEGVQSPVQREQLRRWFRGSLMRSGWRDTKVVVIGNLLHHDCLLANLLKNPLFDSVVFKALEAYPVRADLWSQWRGLVTDLSNPNKEKAGHQFYEQHRAEMDEGAKVAWPDAMPLYDLMLVQVSEGEYSFNMELQNDPKDPNRQLFTAYQTYRSEVRDGNEVWIVPLNGRPACKLSDCLIFGFTDPSLGESSRATKSAIAIVAKLPYGTMVSLESDAKIRPPHEIMKAQDAWAMTYRILMWGIEKVQFQALFATRSSEISAERGIYLPIAAIPQSENKDLRIQSLQPDLENGYLLLPEHGQEELKQELAEWPTGAYKDAADALEGARTMAKRWKPIIGAESVQAEVYQFSKEQRRDARPGESNDPYAEWDALADEKLRELRAAREVEREAPLPMSTGDLLAKVVRVGDGTQL